MKKKKMKIVAAGLLVSFVCLTGCAVFAGKEEKLVSRTGIYFDTSIQIQVVHENAEELLADCFVLCQNIEKIFDRTREDSELYQVNHRTNNTLEISRELAEVISVGLLYGERSGGAFDITVAPVMDLWDFTGENPRVPEEREIQEALERVDYRSVHISGTTLTFERGDTMLDLGAIAKGYAADLIRDYLKDQGVKSGLVNLGGNVCVIGKKPDGTSFQVGIQRPFADRGETVETVEAEDVSVVSAGTYERYFVQDGVRYFHILDARTGYPADTSFDQVTIVSADSIIGDVLSTCCLILGEEGAKEMLTLAGLPNTWLHFGEGCAMIRQ